MSNLAFVHSILSSTVPLFADAFGFASSTSSTGFLTATVWLELVQYLFRWREECQERNYPHRFLQRFGFPWRFPNQVLTSSGYFAYENPTKRQLKVEGLLENAFSSLFLPSDTWLGQELAVQNLKTPLPMVLWECKHQHHQSLYTSQLIIVSQRQ